MKNHHCYDFAIYYPNEEYYLLLTRQLDQFQISYNHHETIENYALRAIKDLLHYLSDDDENWLLSLISSGYLQYFQDIRYVSLLKKQFYQQNKACILKVQHKAKFKKYATFTGAVFGLGMTLLEFVFS